VLAHAAQALARGTFGARLAVVGPGQAERRELLTKNGWSVVENARSAEGQATSLVCGLEQVYGDQSIDRVLVLLGDMPFVTDAHLEKLLTASTADAVISEANGVRLPPALFKRACFEALLSLRGDQGARHVFAGTANAKVIIIDPESARDIDTR